MATYQNRGLTMINETTYAGISVPKSLMEQCKALIANGKVIDAIKAFRA